MYKGWIVIKTHPEKLDEVGDAITSFEGVVEETACLSGKSAILAHVLTDNEKSFRSFIREQIEPLPGVMKIQGVMV
jgi:hypothetical protein